MDSSIPEILTAQDVARILNCSTSEVYKLAVANQLPISHKLFEGRKGMRWEKGAVLRYLESKRISDGDEEPEPGPFRPVHVVRRLRSQTAI